MPRQPIENPSDLRLDTHWSRFVYCDEPVEEDTFVAHRHAPAPNWRRGTPGNDDLGEDPTPGGLSKHELYLAAHARRRAALRTLVVAAVQSARDFVDDALTRYRRHREMRGIYDTLQALDDRTLRDLGFHRSEIMSVAAEVVEEAERTRVRTLRMPRAPRW